MRYSQHFNTKKTSQQEQIPGRTDQVKNNAGGFVFDAGMWRMLDRFLTIGTEGGTYYVDEHKLTIENAQNILSCIKEDGVRVVRQTREISVEGRAPSNNPALFVLALAFSNGDKRTKNEVRIVFNEVVRTGTHLLHFVDAVDALRGWGRSLKTLVSKWYEDRRASDLAYQVAKYQQRDGWSHLDVLRKAHPKATSVEHAMIYNWIWYCRGNRDKAPQRADSVFKMIHNTEPRTEALEYIWAWEQAKTTTSVKRMISLITDYRLTHENVPNQFKNDPRIWEALLQHMPLGALIRNLGKMSSVGLITQGSDAARLAQKKILDVKNIERSRIHPINVLVAMRIYNTGLGLKGNLSWNPVARITDALDSTFYAAFKNVEPTDKAICLALDVSASMGTFAAGKTGLSAREISAALALVMANVESDIEIVAFSAKMIPLNISPRQRLEDAIKAVSRLPFGRTDCALPMMWAMGHNTVIRGGGLYSRPGEYAHFDANKYFDTFVIYTDNETWCGDIHPVQALQKYRKEVNPSAKLIVNAMTPTKFSIADPKDAGMLDVSGFDSATPKVIADFIRND